MSEQPTSLDRGVAALPPVAPCAPLGRTRIPARVRERVRPLAFPLAVWALSRLLYLLVGYLSPVLVPELPEARSPDLRWSGPLEAWARWDGARYVAIALHGYQAATWENVAFFPLYPLSIRLLAASGLARPVPAGLVISLVSSLAAFWFTYRLVADAWGVATARRALLCLALFPTSFYFNAVYTESLFLALSAGSLWAARVRKDLPLAAALAGLASATRNVGILLLIPLAATWVRGRMCWRRGVLTLGLAPLGLLGYMGFLGLQFGDLLLFSDAQSAYWSRQFTRPDLLLAVAFANAWKGAGYLLHPAAFLTTHTVHNSLYAGDAYNLVALALVLALLALGARRLPIELTLYAVGLTVLPALFAPPKHPLFSLPRFALVALPLFITLALLLRSRVALAAWLLPSGAAAVFLCAVFVSGRWVA